MVRWTALNAKKGKAASERRRLALIDGNVEGEAGSSSSNVPTAMRKNQKRPASALGGRGGTKSKRFRKQQHAHTPVVVSPALDEDVAAIKDTLRKLPVPKVLMPPPPVPIAPQAEIEKTKTVNNNEEEEKKQTELMPPPPAVIKTPQQVIIT